MPLQLGPFPRLLADCASCTTTQGEDQARAQDSASDLGQRRHDAIIIRTVDLEGVSRSAVTEGQSAPFGTIRARVAPAASRRHQPAASVVRLRSVHQAGVCGYCPDCVVFKLGLASRAGASASVAPDDRTPLVAALARPAESSSSNAVAQGSWDPYTSNEAHGLSGFISDVEPSK